MSKTDRRREKLADETRPDLRVDGSFVRSNLQIALAAPESSATQAMHLRFRVTLLPRPFRTGTTHDNVEIDIAAAAVTARVEVELSSETGWELRRWIVVDGVGPWAGTRERKVLPETLSDVVLDSVDWKDATHGPVYFAFAGSQRRDPVHTVAGKNVVRAEGELSDGDARRLQKRTEPQFGAAYRLESDNEYRTRIDIPAYGAAAETAP